jgi:uncharacterized membrane protein YbhN (UPF0104 family)
VSWFLKTLIAALFLTLLWYDLFKRENFDDIYVLFLSELRGENTYWLFATLIFLPLNWAAETLKWLPLVRHVQNLSFFEAFKAVFAGVTFSLFFPNRTGEFGGRILFLKKKNAFKGVISTFIGSWAQQLILITFGFLGFIYFLITLWDTDKIVVDAIIMLGLVLVGLLFLMFLNLEAVVPVFRKLRFLYRFPRLIKSVGTLRQYTRRELFEALFWSFVRYLVYSLQYYFMLRFFGIDVPIFQAASCIATIYLLQTSIPLPPVVGLLARGEVALKIWGLFTHNDLSILAATFSLWVINLIIPAFIGLIFILRINFFQTKKSEKDIDNQHIASENEKHNIV